MQNGRPVAYISRTLNHTEFNYAEIEKEYLTGMFAFLIFRQCAFGKQGITVI